MTKILNQNVLAHIYLVDIKFKHQENTYRARRIPIESNAITTQIRALKTLMYIKMKFG